MILAAAALVVGVVGGLTIWAVSSDESEPSSSIATNCPVRIEPGSDRVRVGDRISEFALPGLDGTCFDSSDYRGRPLIVNFWASWCNPCRTEFPLFADARDRYEADHVAIVGVVYRDITSDAQRFAAERDVEWPLVVDDDQLVAQIFGVDAIPQTFFVNAEGIVVSRVFGLSTRRELDREIRRIIPD